MLCAIHPAMLAMISGGDDMQTKIFSTGRRVEKAGNHKNHICRNYINKTVLHVVEGPIDLPARDHGRERVRLKHQPTSCDMNVQSKHFKCRIMIHSGHRQ